MRASLLLLVGVLVGSASTLLLPRTAAVWTAIGAFWLLATGLTLLVCLASDANRKLQRAADSTRSRFSEPRPSPARPLGSR